MSTFDHKDCMLSEAPVRALLLELESRFDEGMIFIGSKRLTAVEGAVMPWVVGTPVVQSGLVSMLCSYVANMQKGVFSAPMKEDGPGT